MKVIVIATGLTAPLPPTPTFEDVPTTQPFYTWIEIGVANGVVSGYACGGRGRAVRPRQAALFPPRRQCQSRADRQDDPPRPGSTRRKPHLQTSRTTPYFRDVPPAAAFIRLRCGGREPCPGTVARLHPRQACKIRGAAPHARPTGPDARHATQTRQPSRRPTRTRTRADQYAGRPPAPVFPPDNIWNRNIAALPTHALSAAYIASIGTEHRRCTPTSAPGLCTAAPSASPIRPCPATSRACRHLRL